MRIPFVFMAVAAVHIAATPQLAAADPKHCPPGHAKKGWCGSGYSQGQRHRDSAPRREYVIIRDYDRYGLRAPRDGYYYGVYDEEVFLVSRATQEIIEGLGAVSYLLRR
ncbi:MAG: RcnB family protein [Paracoccaceae bacterium]